MNNKLKAILIIVIFTLLCIGSYLIFEPAINMTFERINLTDSCSAEVPVTDKNSTYTDNLGIEYYYDYEHNLNITSFNTQNNVTASQGIMKMERIKSSTLGTQKVNESGVTAYRNDNLDSYGMFIDDKKSHNQILISAHSLELLSRVYKSLLASVVIDPNEDTSSYDSGYSESSSYASSSSGSSYSSGSDYSSSGGSDYSSSSYSSDSSASSSDYSSSGSDYSSSSYSSDSSSSGSDSGSSSSSDYSSSSTELLLPLFNFSC